MKLETHIHTKPVSRCADCTPEEAVARCLALGYDGMVLTNHFHAEFHPHASWSQRVSLFLNDYHAARNAAPPGFLVLPGMELRFCGENSNDYLIYGMDEDFLRANKGFDRLGIAKFSAFAREHDLLTVQAHPFRYGMTVVRPKYLDGMEVYNGHAGHKSHNPIAEAWAKMYDLPPLSGSDYHGGDTGDGAAPGGIDLHQPVADVQGLVRAIRGGAYELLR